MPTVNAAVVTAFEEPPHYGPFVMPEPAGPDEALVEVEAVGLHPRVRTGARGGHYTSSGALPMVPGVDGVGHLPDGRTVWFAVDDAAHGSMAERTVVDLRRTVELPAEVDPALVAATMNPAMSSWVALRRRISLPPAASVLVLGATGNAGTIAVQLADRLGAARIIGAGRDPERLAALTGLGAAETVDLAGDPATGAAALADAAAEVDVVLDYLWGPVSQAAIPAILTARSDRARTLRWIQIGAIAGPEILLPSAWLRSADLRLLGSGQGSVGAADYLAALPDLVTEIARGTLDMFPRVVPLAEVTEAWSHVDAPGQRTVLVP